MQKTCWPSVDAAVKDVSRDYEELRELLVAALEKTVMALENDSAILRRQLTAMAQPDGSVQMAYTKEAWELLRKLEGAM